MEEEKKPAEQSGSASVSPRQEGGEGTADEEEENPILSADCEPGELPLSWAEPLVEPLRFNDLIKTREEVVQRTRSRSFCGIESLGKLQLDPVKFVDPSPDRNFVIPLEKIITKERQRTLSNAGDVPLFVWRSMGIGHSDSNVVISQQRGETRGDRGHKKSRSTSGWESWSALSSTNTESVHLSPEMIDLSLEMSNKFFLENILKDTVSCKVLMNFMKARHCHENLCFWLAVEDYKAIHNPTIRAAKAVEISNKFLQSGGQLEINISSSVLHSTLENLKNPQRDSFDDAQKAIFYLMVHGVFEYFLSSERYNYELARTGRTEKDKDDDEELSGTASPRSEGEKGMSKTSSKWKLRTPRGSNKEDSSSSSSGGKKGKKKGAERCGIS